MSQDIVDTRWITATDEEAPTMQEQPGKPTYVLQSHAPAVDDPDWTICTFQDPASPDTAGLTVTVSEGTLQRLTDGDLTRPLEEGEVTALDGR
jgi:hypothetical protein